MEALSPTRNEMSARSHNPAASVPRIVVRVDDKQLARPGIKAVLSCLYYADKDERLRLPDPRIVLICGAASLENGALAP